MNGAPVPLIHFARWSMPFCAAAIMIAGDSAPDASSPDGIDQQVVTLQRLTAETKAAVRRFPMDLDASIAQYDRGYPRSDGERIYGADADIARERETVRKCFAARVIATPNQSFQQLLAADIIGLERLIAAIRTAAVDSAGYAQRQRLMVSAHELDRRHYSASRAKEREFRKARAAALEAMKRAVAVLPVNLPLGVSAEDTRQKTWEFLISGTPGRIGSPYPAPAPTDRTEPLIPIQWRRGERAILIDEPGYRIALTDSGTDDPMGRHVFYEEEWIEHGLLVFRRRWRVGVEASTGQHIILKRYALLQYEGQLSQVFSVSDREYLWTVEPDIDSTEPSKTILAESIRNLAASRQTAWQAVAAFQSSLRSAIAQNDSSLSGTNRPDTGVPEDLRVKLFAIRAHLAGDPTIVSAERRVRDAISGAGERIRQLEGVAAWANRASGDFTGNHGMSESEWERFEEESGREIDLTHREQRHARYILPPEFSKPEDAFPALGQQLAVRIRVKRTVESGVSCTQEIWRLDAVPYLRRVHRISTLIRIDPLTGEQKRIAEASRYYDASEDETVEEVYDQYAADELPLETVDSFPAATRISRQN